MGQVMFDTNVFISYVSDLLPPAFPAFMRRYLVEYEVKMAVQPPQIAERCLAAWRALEALSDEDWDAIEPNLVEEIAVLHALCATDKDL